MSNYVTLDVRSNSFPCQGPRVIPIVLDFSVSESFDVNLQQIVSNGKIEEIQGLYVDNSKSVQRLKITCADTNQIIYFPAGYQGYMPTLTQSPQYKLENLDAGAIVNIHILNFPTPAYMWIAGETAAQNVNLTNAYIPVVQNEPVKISQVSPVSGETKKLSVSTTSANINVSSSDIWRVTNTLNEIVFCRFGTGAQTSTIADVPILPNAFIDIGANSYDNVGAITLSGTGDIYITPLTN